MLNSTNQKHNWTTENKGHVFSFISRKQKDIKHNREQLCSKVEGEVQK